MGNSKSKNNPNKRKASPSISNQDIPQNATSTAKKPSDDDTSARNAKYLSTLIHGFTDDDTEYDTEIRPSFSISNHSNGDISPVNIMSIRNATLIANKSSDDDTKREWGISLSTSNAVIAPVNIMSVMNTSRTPSPDSNYNDSDSYEVQKQVALIDALYQSNHGNHDQDSKLSSNPSQTQNHNAYYLRPAIYLQNEIDTKITFHERLLIFGYVRDTERQYDGTLSYTVPISIIYLFAAYYCVFRDEWNRRYCGESVMFIGHKIIKKISQHKIWTICAFGYQVNDKVCDTLNVQFTWKSAHGLGAEFNIGYIKINENIDKISYDGFELGDGNEVNRINSVRIPIDGVVNSTDYDSDDGLAASSDSFIVFSYLVVFNFVTERLYLHRNNKLVKTMKFECKSILPAIAIFNKGDMVEVSKYEIIRNEDEDDTEIGFTDLLKKPWMLFG